MAKFLHSRPMWQRVVLLILGVPGDPEAFQQLGPYNRLLMAVGSGIEVLPAIADDESHRYLSVMFPQCYFQPVPGTFAARGVDRNLVLDRSTILVVRPPALALARTSHAAFAVTGLGLPRLEGFPNRGGFPIVALARCGKGYVLVTGRFNLNVGGYNGRVGVQPVTSLDWVPSSDRFIQNILTEMVGLSGRDRKWNGSHSEPAYDRNSWRLLPAAPPAGVPVVTVPPGGSIEKHRSDHKSYQARYPATIRRDLYGPYLEHGLRAAWGDTDRDDQWLKRLAEGFKRAGLNYIWGVGWPERFVLERIWPLSVLS